jgi:hypothetical protein
MMYDTQYDIIIEDALMISLSTSPRAQQTKKLSFLIIKFVNVKYTINNNSIKQSL